MFYSMFLFFRVIITYSIKIRGYIAMYIKQNAITTPLDNENHLFLT